MKSHAVSTAGESRQLNVKFDAQSISTPNESLSSAYIDPSRSTKSSTSLSSFNEKKFRLPPRDVKLDIIVPQEKRKEMNERMREENRRRNLARREVALLCSLDIMKSTPPVSSISSCNILQSTRIHKECMAELEVVQKVISRTPGEHFSSNKASKRPILPSLSRNNILEESEYDENYEDVDNGDVDEDESSNSITSSHLEREEKKRLMDIQEKVLALLNLLHSLHFKVLLSITCQQVEDLLQEDVERWLKRHGKELSAKHSNQQKRLLRKWFKGSLITLCPILLFPLKNAIFINAQTLTTTAAAK